MIIKCTVSSSTLFTAKTGNTYHRIEFIPDEPLTLSGVQSRAIPAGTRCFVSFRNGKVEDISIDE